MKKIKLFDPIIGISEEKEIVRILRSGFWASGAGTHKVQQFEDKFREYLGSDQCVAVNSGTAALNLSLNEVKTLIINSFKSSFLKEKEKMEWIKQI